MKRSNLTLILTLSVALSMQASAVFAGKGGSGGGGGNHGSGGSSKPAMSSIKMSTSSLSGNQFKSTNAMKFTQNNTATLNANTIGKIGKLTDSSTPYPPQRTAHVNSTVKLNQDTVKKLGGLGTTDKGSKTVKLNRETVKKLGGLGITDKGGSGGSKDPGKGGDKGKGKGCDPYCDNYHGWCYGFPFFYPFTTPCYYGNCGPSYCNTYVQPVPVVTTAVAFEAQPAKAIDLEVVEVLQIDRGDAQQGPAYRVVIRNNSTLDVAAAFDVTVAGSTSRQLSAESPHAAVRINGLKARQMGAIEIRLPIEALSLGKNAAGADVPFAWLTAVVDGRHEVQEVNLDNNVQMLHRAEIVMAE